MKKMVLFCMLVLFFFSSGTVFGDTFDDITITEIMDAELSGENIFDDQLLPGTILIYQTSADRYGKLEILTVGDDLFFTFVTYDDSNDGTVFLSYDDASIEVGGAVGFDLDSDHTVYQPSNAPLPPIGDDFFWKPDAETGYFLDPATSGAPKFAVYNPVPIPSAFLLFTSSLIGIAGIRKKFRK